MCSQLTVLIHSFMKRSRAQSELGSMGGGHRSALSQRCGACKLSHMRLIERTDTRTTSASNTSTSRCSTPPPQVKAKAAKRSTTGKWCAECAHICLPHSVIHGPHPQAQQGGSSVSMSVSMTCVVQRSRERGNHRVELLCMYIGHPEVAVVPSARGGQLHEVVQS